MIKSNTVATFIGSKEITEISIAYSRPLVKGRVIFDGLVPYGRLWRTGADGNTIISFSRDVLIHGALLRQGKYALYTVPGPEQWDIIFYGNYSNYGLPRPWNAGDVVLKVTADSYLQKNHTEAMTININILSNAAGQLELLWEKIGIAINFEIPAQIEEKSAPILLGGIPETDYYCAAEFYGKEGNDPARALWSISSVLENNEKLPYFYYWQKALLEAKTGNLNAAIKTAQIAFDAAFEANNEQYQEIIESALVQWRAV